MQNIAGCAQGASLKELEAIRPYISAPWDAQLIDDCADDGVQAAAQAQQTQGIRVATSASARSQMVGVSGVVDGIVYTSNVVERGECVRTIGTSTQVNACTAALASIQAGVRKVAWAIYMGEPSPQAHSQAIHVFTNNRAALATLRTPARRSGQEIVDKILKRVQNLEKSGNRVIFAWAPVH